MLSPIIFSFIMSLMMMVMQGLKETLRKRVPDFQIIISQTGQYLSALTQKKPASSDASDEVQAKLMAESSLRLFNYYQKFLPEVVVESQFDFGKLVLNRDISSLPPSVQYQLITLLLNANDIQFRWMSQSTSGSGEV